MPVCRKPITGATLLRAVNTPLCVIGKEEDKKMTIPMALMDFLPVLLFGAAWAILYRDLKNKLDLCSGILLPLGALTVLLAGFFKAVWKLQNALGVTPVELFNKAFFPAQSIGFVLLGVGMLALMYGKRRIVRSLTMVFVMGMVLGNLGMSAGLVYIARRMKVKAGILLFILSFVLILMMGYLSSRDFAQASMHWVAQSVNLLGEGLLFVGALLLHRAGLASPDALS